MGGALVIILVVFVADELISGRFERQGFFTMVAGSLVTAPFLFLLDRSMRRRDEDKRVALRSRDPDEDR